MKAIVDFAYLRGIRVIPEFDMPGHSTGICDALKGIGIVCCSGKWGMGQIGDDPEGNSTRIVGALLAEMAAIFPDAVLNIGSDECAYGTTGACTLNATKSFEQKMIQKVISLGKQPMGWQEILLETGAAATFPQVIVDTWHGGNTWAGVAGTGHQAVVSDPASLYLDGRSNSLF